MINTSDCEASEYVIILKNGTIINSPTFSEEGGKVYFEQFGSKVAINREIVEAIKPKNIVVLTDQKDGIPTKAPLPLPIYFSVSGSTNKDMNGLYEETGQQYNNRRLFRQINGRYMLFAYASQRPVSAPIWAIGEFSDRRPSQVFFINSSIKGAEFPENEGGWISGGILHPQLRVTRAIPPLSVYSGNHTYNIKGFPIKDCNGVYKPKSYSNGYISYAHTEHPYQLHNYDDSWMISICKGNCFTQFTSKRLSGKAMPEDIAFWYDIRGNQVTVNSSISVFSHPSVIVPINSQPGSETP